MSPGGSFGLLAPMRRKVHVINILAGLVTKTSGSAEIWGFDTDAQPRNAKRSIGIVPQEIVFDPFFTPFEVLENQGGFYGVTKPNRRSEELLKAVHLWDKRDAYARTLRRDEAAAAGGQAMVHFAPDPGCSTSRPQESTLSCAGNCGSSSQGSPRKA